MLYEYVIHKSTKNGKCFNKICKNINCSYDIFSSSKGSADDSQKGSVPKTIVEPSQGPSSKKADGSSPPLLSTGAKAKRPKTGGGAAGVGASVKRTTSEMKNDLAPKTKQAGLTGRKLSRDRKKI